MAKRQSTELVPRSTPPAIPAAALNGKGGKSGAPAPAEPDDPPAGPEAAPALIEALLKTVLLPAGSRMQQGDVIGRGGMGTVSRTFDWVLHRSTANKTLMHSVRAHPVIVRAFIREAQITAQLDHLNIVPVHDIGIDDEGRPFFTMKLVEGRTLAQLIDSGAQSHRYIDRAYDELLNLLEIICKVCDALAFAHSRGVIHCDIKAQNIMVGDFGQVHLMDWGFAQLMPQREGRKGPRVEDPLPKLPEESSGGFLFGTPGYMSPEQARGQIGQMDERSDVFSLGALLYQILTGEVPFRGKTPADAVMRAQSCDFPPLEEQAIGPYTLRPKELVRIVMRAMARRPEERYQSVEALKTDLVCFLRGGTNFPTRHVEAGVQIIREGEAAEAAYIIVAGECEVYRMVDGRRDSLRVLKAGEVFGEMALLLSQPRSASVVARTPVSLVVVTRDVVEQELSSMKPWMGVFIRTLANRIRDQAESRIPRPGPAEHEQQSALAPEGEEPATTASGKHWWMFW